MTDEPPTILPTPADALTLELAMPLPASIAEFGIAEQLVLPAELLQQWAGNPDLGPMLQEGVLRMMSRVSYSIATTLNAILQMRVETGAPLTHEVYLAHQQELLDARQRAAEAAAAAVQAMAHPEQAL